MDFSGPRHRTPGSRLQRVVMALTLCLAAPGMARAAEHAHVLGKGVQIDCVQPELTTLDCDYRLLDPAPVTGVKSRIGETPLPAGGPEKLPPGKSAVLFLVDTSDPARQGTIARIAEHIRLLAETATGNHALGFATFDTDLHVISPLGSSAGEIAGAAEKMHAAGATTELYRNTLRAVQLLGDFPASRRAIFLFSDGLAEDRAYFHEDVIKTAVAQGVVIFGFGYPRSVPLSVALQTVRRLSEETGGRYLQADAALNLSTKFLEKPFARLDNGGHLSLDLRPAVHAGHYEGAEVHVELTTDAGDTLSARVPVVLPAPPPETTIVEAKVPAETPAAAPAPAARPAALPPQPAPPQRNRWWVSAVIVGAVLILGAVLLMRQKKRSESEPDDEPVPPVDSHAFLEIQDGSGVRYPISSAEFRIGRSSENELTLHDPSISRHHAQIRRKRDGSFSITDLESLNGVFVNSTQVKTSKLTEADLVELGDVGFRFTTSSAESIPEHQETVLLKTAIRLRAKD
jgi:hypothetical protein